ncbi:hypothetical protein, partial [Klebsiella pneumoniae]|uniref:hypothetical protein n=1 Tax=Klebsiella pneumoniae TaxID=573 RepID=UPI001E2D4EB9
ILIRKRTPLSNFINVHEKNLNIRMAESAHSTREETSGRNAKKEELGLLQKASPQPLMATLVMIKCYLP